MLLVQFDVNIVVFYKYVLKWLVNKYKMMCKKNMLLLQILWH